MHCFVDIFNVNKMIQNLTTYFYDDIMSLFYEDRLNIRSDRI